jgi:AraC family transcriptional regulator, regulatory protein of adaptative response / DNA-3-methyladenine glycosylase II
VAERLLGLGTVPAGFAEAFAQNPLWAKIANGRQGLHLAQSASVFEGVAWAIIGQQINLAFAYRLRQRYAVLCGQAYGVVNGRQMHAHPTAEATANLRYEDLTPFQFSRRKAEYLIDTARLVAAGKLDLDPQRPADELERDLLAVRGLGPWSVNYILMRGFGLPNCAPLGDTGLGSALQAFYQRESRPNNAETLALMATFAPYRSFATYHFWLNLNGDPA